MNRISKIHLAAMLPLLVVLALLVSASAAQAQTTTFTYQGRFTDNQNGGNATTGSYDFQFKLFDALNGGSQLGSTVDRGGVTVTNSTFTVQLDFGAGVFPGANRWLEISVRQAGSGSFSTLNPRQPVTSTPYAIRSLSAATAETANTATTANNALQLNGQAASQFVLTGDSRLSDARTPTAGSGNYIQNTTNQQGNSNFNISGNGTAGGNLSANLVNAATQFNLNGNRVLSSPAENLFVGIGAGNPNSPGLRNAFFGQNAGSSITTGADNSFFGRQTGLTNSTGILNSFFGTEAGPSNQTGSRNTFVGARAGLANNTGGSNSFFGQPVGTANTTGSANSFFGASAGELNTSGNLNTFMGAAAGDANTTGDRNSYFGRAAGRGNATGSKNTIIGDSARFGADNLSNATAVGADAVVSESNALVLGSINGVNNATADTNVGIGTTSPLRRLHVAASLSKASTGPFSAFAVTTNDAANPFGLSLAVFGAAALAERAISLQTTDFGLAVGGNILLQPGGGNVGIGTLNPGSRLTVAGVIESSTGGVKFPDGTVQTSAASGGNAIQNTTAQQANANFNISGNGTIGGTLTAGTLSSTGDTLLMRGKQALSNKGPSNVFAGEQAGAVSSLNTGGANSFFGAFSGSANTSGSLNTFIGVSSGGSNTTGDNLTLLGRSSDVGSSNLSNATAIGSKAQVSQSNALVLGSINGVNSATADTNVGIGTTTPIDRLTVQVPVEDSTTGISLVGPTVALSATLLQGAALFGTRSNSNLSFFTNSILRMSVLANGNVQVNGTLSKGAGSFKIDHPLDPENKYLYHSFVESPDMMNIYNGVVTLDQAGQAEVELPDYFDALNRDFRYQLTAIGGPGPYLHIAQKVAGNRFRIAGGAPGLEVSWQVTGIRQDAFANKNRIPVEEAKPETDRGHYLHPEAYGKPMLQGVGAVRPRKQ